MYVHERGAVAKAQADAQPLRNALASVDAPERFAAPRPLIDLKLR